MKFYLSTIASDAVETAREYGLGLEIAEYCTAWNIDKNSPEIQGLLCKKLQGVSDRVFHAPFNELFPCAIDPRARALAADRYRQAILLAKNYGAQKIVIHGGYNPWLYYPVWYVNESIKFWKAFFQEDPGIPIVLENVLEEQPQMLMDIVQGMDNPRLRLCLDIGHVNAYSKIPVIAWLKSCAPYISHFHIHNNSGDRDSHSPLREGTIPMEEFLEQAQDLCPDASLTLELMEAKHSVKWLKEELWI